MSYKPSIKTTLGFSLAISPSPRKTGGFHPILDLILLNNYIVTTKFCMVTLESVLSFLHRPKRWLLSYCNTSCTQKIPSFPTWITSIPIQKTPIQQLPCNSSESIHRAHGAGSRLPQTSKHSRLSIYRWLAPCSTLPLQSSMRHPFHLCPSSRSRSNYQQTEINIKTCKDYTLHKCSHRLHMSSHIPPCRK